MGPYQWTMFSKLRSTLFILSLGICTWFNWWPYEVHGCQHACTPVEPNRSSVGFRQRDVFRQTDQKFKLSDQWPNMLGTLMKWYYMWSSIPGVLDTQVFFGVPFSGPWVRSLENYWISLSVFSGVKKSNILITEGLKMQERTHQAL